MKTMLRLLSALLLCLTISAPVLAQEDVVKKRVAVYTTGKDVDDAYKKVLNAKIVAAVAGTGRYAVIERNSEFLSAITEETDMQTSGEVRNDQIVALGQRYGARFVIVADASELFDELFIASRLINVATGLIEKAYDVNGPAESMSQLVTLSQKVAAGLLGGGSGSASVSGSSVPQNLALCVMDRNGKYLYLSPEQWQQTPESTKVFYVKKGVCLMENGDGFLVDMHDKGKGNWNYACSNGAPKVWQLKLMYKWKDALNQALRIYGGSPLADTSGDNPWYWSCETYPNDSSLAWSFYMATGYVSHGNKTYVSNRVRAVLSLPSSANNSF